jgi:hypothetical protein
MSMYLAEKQLMYEPLCPPLLDATPVPHDVDILLRFAYSHSWTLTLAILSPVPLLTLARFIL